ncbi:MAG: hypothetical protein ACE5IK_14255, partial [Acidobacteriota bacterium]
MRVFVAAAFVSLGILSTTPSLAVVRLCTAPTMTSESCGTETDVQAFIDPNFVIKVKNCTGQPSVAALIEMVYAKHLGALTDSDDFGADE